MSKLKIIFFEILQKGMTYVIKRHWLKRIQDYYNNQRLQHQQQQNTTQKWGIINSMIIV